MSVNKAILVGNLGKDPEVRFTGSGKAVCKFPLATTTSWNDTVKGPIAFDNGERRVYDVRPLLGRGVFSQLRDAALFNDVRVSFDTNLRLKPALAAALSTEGYGAVAPIPRADVVRAR